MNDIIPIGDAIRFGLNYEKMRLEAASYNLAMANVVLNSGDNSSAMSVGIAPTPFANTLGLPQLIREENQATKAVHDPSNPYANEQGYVFYPDIDPTREMVTLVSATRAYEANVRAFNTLYQMSSKALEIGGRR